MDMISRIYQAASVTTSFTRELNVAPYSALYVWVTLDGVTGTPSGGSFALKVQYTDPMRGDGPTDTEWLDIPGAAIATVAYNASFPRTQVIVLGPDQIASTRMRIVGTVSLSGGSSPAFTTTLSYLGRM